MSSFANAAYTKQIVTYFDIASAALLFYDYLITLPEEVTYVWPTRWNIGKVLFLLTRYPVFADTTLVLVHQFQVLDATQCKIIFTTIGWMLGVGVGIAEIILSMRTWVIWGRDKRIAFFLGSLLVVLWIPVFWFDNEALSSLVFTSPPNPNTPGCFLISQKNILYAVFILIMSFETVILTLTLIKGLEHFRRAGSPLVTVLYRDGILNYVYLFILSVINLVVITSAPHGFTTLLTAMQRVAHSILSGRILLHLRQAASVRVVTSRMYRDGTTGPSLAVSASWKFNRRAAEKRSFIDTIREEFREDTETWFGNESGEHTATGISHTSGTDVEMQMEGAQYRHTAKATGQMDLGDAVRNPSPDEPSVYEDGPSHLDM